MKTKNGRTAEVQRRQEPPTQNRGRVQSVIITGYFEQSMPRRI